MSDTPKADEVELLKCCDCGKQTVDVKMQPCPFAQEIHFDNQEYPLCPDCWEERAQDI